MPSALHRLLTSERDTNLNSVGRLFRNWESPNLLALGASARFKFINNSVTHSNNESREIHGSVGYEGRHRACAVKGRHRFEPSPDPLLSISIDHHALYWFVP